MDTYDGVLHLTNARLDTGTEFSKKSADALPQAVADFEKLLKEVCGRSR